MRLSWRLLSCRQCEPSACQTGPPLLRHMAEISVGSPPCSARVPRPSATRRAQAGQLTGTLCKPWVLQIACIPLGNLSLRLSVAVLKHDGLQRERPGGPLARLAGAAPAQVMIYILRSHGFCVRTDSAFARLDAGASSARLHVGATSRSPGFTPELPLG
jgi:hypothetical protein